MSVSSASDPGRSALTPVPISRKAVPSISFASISRETAKIFAASCVGAWIDCERVRCLKSAVFNFSVMVNPERSPFLSRIDTFSDSRHSSFSRVTKSRMSVSNVVSLEMVLAPRSGTTRRSSMPRASRHSLRPSLENCFISSISSACCRSAMVRKPRCDSRSWVAGPTPKMNPTGLSASIARAST
jgi:hypothetical protein